MNFFRKTKGTISLFLALVLMALLAIDCVLIDGSRKKAADMIVKSSVDSAVMSVLADYNTTLKNSYGLFAMNYADDSAAQTMFKKYFEPMIKSTSGAGGDNLDTLLNMIGENLAVSQDKFVDAKFVDLLKLSPGETVVNGVYPLSEPMVLRNQIVQFSKYRMPAFWASSMFSDAASEMENISKDMDMQNEKQKVDKSLSEFLEKVDDMKQKIDELNKGGQASGVADGCSIAQGAILEWSQKTEELRRKKQSLTDQTTNVKKLESTSNGNNDIGDNTQSDTLKKEQDDLKNAEKEVKDAQKTVDEAKARAESAISAFKEENAAFKEELDRLKEELEDLKNESTEQISALETFRDNMKNSGGSQGADGTTGEIMAKEAQEHIDKIKKIDFDKAILDVETQISNLIDAETAVSQMQGEVSNVYNAVNNSSTGTHEAQSKSDKQMLVGFDVSGLKQTIDFNYENPPANQTQKEQYEKAKKKASSKSDTANKNAKEYNKNEAYKISDSDLPSDLYKQNQTSSIQKFAEQDKAAFSNETSGVNDDVTLTNEEQQGMDEGKSTAEQEGKKVEIKVNGKNSDSSISDITGIFKGITKAIEGAADSIIINEYALNMFKNRTTEIKYENEPDVEPYEPYIDEIRFDPRENLFWESLADTNTKFAKGEVEYILWGNKNEAVNINAVYTEILLMRTAINLSALYLDGDTRNIVNGIAAAAGPAQPIVSVAIMSAWALSESLIEMDALVNKGYKISLLKKMGDGGNFILSLESFLGDGDISMKPQQMQSGVKIMFSYEDYLRLRLLLVSINDRLLRIADLVQINTEVKMSQANTFLRVQSEVTMPFTFVSSPLIPNGYRKNGEYTINNVFYQGY